MYKGYSLVRLSIMKEEQRRHPRIRFANQPRVRIGQFGFSGAGELENLSLGGLMLRTDLPLKVGEACGCEFVVFDSPLIDVSAVIVSKIGDLFGARFQPGPVSEILIREAIDRSLASGNGSVLSINDLQGRKVMRVSGGLNRGLRNDFMHHLSRSGVEDLDLSEVTGIDHDGFDLCRIAVQQHKVRIVRSSPCVRAVLANRFGEG